MIFQETIHPSKTEWDLTNGPLRKLRSSYEILRFFLCPFSVSCWRFLGIQKSSRRLVEANSIAMPTSWLLRWAGPNSKDGGSVVEDGCEILYGMMDFLLKWLKRIMLYWDNL